MATNQVGKPPKPKIIEVYSVRQSQSVYDLAVQLYGTISNIGKLLEIFPNLNIQVPFGSVINLEDQADPIVTFFKGKVVATFSDSEFVIPSVTFDSSLITFDSTVYTWDNV